MCVAAKKRPGFLILNISPALLGVGGFLVGEIACALVKKGIERVRL